MAQFAQLMDQKLKPLQDEVKAVKTAVNLTNDEVGAIRTALGQQMQATSDLKQRVGNIEYSSDWYWKNLDGRLKSIEFYQRPTSDSTSMPRLSAARPGC